jgi:ribonuclease Z
VLFDIGDLGALAPRRILRVSDVFVSHAHMDHFAGLDRLLRVCLGRHAGVRLYGPSGFLERVEHKLAAYTWNLAANYPGDFTLTAHEATPEWGMRRARFRSGAAFRREALPDTEAPEGVLLAEPRFRVRAAFLDHGIPCLGFALEEKVHVNVLKNRLAEIGLAPGHWLNDLKRAIAEDSPGDTPIRAWWRDRNGEHEHVLALRDLLQAVHVEPGRKLAYVTDIRYTPDNESRVARLAAGADLLYIESVFLSSESDHAARKNHLTAEQAGRMARAARAKSVVPFHFSPRYEAREAELVEELEAARRAAP